METKKEKMLQTPNQRALYYRLGNELAEEQSKPYHENRAIKIAKLANEMTKIYLARIAMERHEKEMGRNTYIREVERAEMDKD